MDKVDSLASLTNEPTSVGTQTTPPGDRQLVNSLVKLWRRHEERGLELRWTTGQRLNVRLGLPTTRLAHGEEVLKKVAEQLQIAESELSRMRWFAHRFESVTTFREAHPEVRSWSKVKELLPSLMPTARGAKAKSAAGGQSPERQVEGSGGEAQPPGGAEGAAVLDDVIRALGTATDRLRQNGFVLDDVGRGRVLEAIRLFMESVTDRLQITFPIALSEVKA